MLRHRRSKLLGLAITLTTLAVALAGSQSAQAISVPVLLDSVTVGDGVLVVTGNVDVDTERVKVNGKAVVVGDDGGFSAKVDLDADLLVLDLLESEHESITLRIPIDVLLAQGPDGALDELRAAGISIDLPSDGFQVVDGQMPVVEGRVLDDSNLASLTVNGRDVLRLLGPGGLFAFQPGSSSSTEKVTVIATDRSGVSQTSTFATRRVTTAIRTKAGTSVSAAGARGIRIVKVALDKRFLKPAKYLGVVVTVKDRRGFLIRGAALRLRGMPAKHVANGASKAGFTNRVGNGRFAYRLKASAFTVKAPQYFTIWTRAATPKNSAAKKVTLRLPAVAR
jgi:hypothetical protein